MSAWPRPSSPTLNFTEESDRRLTQFKGRSDKVVPAGLRGRLEMVEFVR